MGGSAGPWVAGRIYDATGTYAPAFTTALVATAVSTAAIWIVAPRHEAARL